ncbi:SGF29 tudor-like domain-containing protein [Sporodiniella umbellata]|nr:SGF29 tudor-like domain-containing protein [Sporodiniella umbellata]
MDRKSRTSRLATLDETNEEVNLWKQICDALSKLEGIQKNTASVVTHINEIHTHLNFEEGLPVSMSKRLMDYYRGGIDLSHNESKIIHDIIEKVSVLIALRDASEYSHVIDQKRKKRRADQEEQTAPLQKKPKVDILMPGTSVAARQPPQKDKDEEWILAVVICYNHEKNKYEVEDVDQDEFGKRQRYMLQPRNVIPIPHLSEMMALPELDTGEDVLALYPGTTCFYKAKVVAPPSKNKESAYERSYTVQFEDDNNEYKHVMSGHVLELPRNNK